MSRIAFDEFEEYDLLIDMPKRTENFFDVINGIVDKEIDTFLKSISGKSESAS